MKYYLSYDEAIQILPDSENIHTFINATFGLLGADWSKNNILNRLKEVDSVIELTGEQARKMGHGMCVYNKNSKYQSDILFIQTDEEKLLLFEKTHETKGE
jgi:hypothetical protein